MRNTLILRGSCNLRMTASIPCSGSQWSLRVLLYQCNYGFCIRAYTCLAYAPVDEKITTTILQSLNVQRQLHMKDGFYLYHTNTYNDTGQPMLYQYIQDYLCYTNTYNDTGLTILYQCIQDYLQYTIPIHAGLPILYQYIQDYRNHK